MNIKTWVAAGTLTVVSVASADALDELVPMPKRVTRTATALLRKNSRKHSTP